MSDTTATTTRKPRLRVELTTPRGSIHEADESLSNSLIGLIQKGEKNRDKKDMLAAVEQLLDTGSKAVMKVATSFLRSLRGG